MLQRHLRITLFAVLFSDPVIVALSGLLQPGLIAAVVPLMLERGFCVALSAVVRVPSVVGDDLTAFEVIAMPYSRALLSSLAPGSGACDTVVASVLAVDVIAIMCLCRV